MVTRSHQLPPLLIFDLDGTLYRTESSFVRTMRQVYANHGIAHPGDAAILSTVGESFDAFVDWLLPQGFRKSRDTLKEEIGRLELQSIHDHGEFYEGVPETLRELSRRGCTITLCTNGDRRYVNAVFARGKIADLFDRLSTLGPDGKTKTERVGDLIFAFPNRLPIVVGDRTHDVVAARANGCRMVGALYGYAHDGELDGADARIASFPELVEVVSQIA